MQQYSFKTRVMEKISALRTDNPTEIARQYTFGEKPQFFATIPQSMGKFMLGGAALGSGLKIMSGMNEADRDHEDYNISDAGKDLAIGGAVGTVSGAAIDSLREILDQHIRIK